MPNIVNLCILKMNNLDHNSVLLLTCYVTEGPVTFLTLDIIGNVIDGSVIVRGNILIEVFVDDIVIWYQSRV